MRRTPRLSAAAVAAVMAMLVAACDSEPPADPNTLRISASSTDRASMEAVIAAFRTRNPGVTVTVTYADPDELQSSLQTELASGSGPDVFTVWPGNGNPAAMQVLEPKGFLADLSSLGFAEQLTGDAKPAVEILGQVYVVPVNYSGIGAIYSTKALAEIGGSVPKTWDDLLNLCGKAKAKGKVLFALGNRTPWVTQLVDYALVATVVYSHDPLFNSKMFERKTTFADSHWEEAMNKYLQMDQQGCFTADPLGTTYEASLTDVARGRAIGVVQIASSLAQIRDEAPGIELGMFALPATDDPADTRIPASVSGAYGVNAKSRNKDLAKKFADFLGSPVGENLYNAGGSTLPAIPNADFKADPALAELLARQKNGTTVPFMDQMWPNPKVQQVHFAQVQDLFAQRITVHQALEAMDRAYQQQ